MEGLKVTVSKNDKPQLSPEEYRELLKHVQLKLIALEEFSAKVLRDKISKSMTIHVKDKISYSIEDVNHVSVLHGYELYASSGAKKDSALKLTCVFKLIYESESALTPQFLDIFTKKNISLNTWPYLREFVHNTTQRMELPPLILPLLK